MSDHLPCPFCGSSDLVETDWVDDALGEIPGVECEKCYGGAKLSVWNQRVAVPAQSTIEPHPLYANKGCPHE